MKSIIHLKFIKVCLAILFVLGFTVPVNGQNLIKPRDEVDITVVGERDISGSFRVSDRGTISLAFIKDVKVSGMTEDQVATKVARMYEDGWLVNPQVYVKVENYAKRRYTVLGQVQRPGVYEIPENETVDLLRAIGAAGGFTRLAKTTQVIIVRQGSSNPIVADAKAMSRKKAALITIRPGDKIKVEERRF